MKLLKLNYLRHKKTIQNFAWRSLQIFCKQGITFLIFILCAKLLNPYDFGIYNYILAIIFFLIMFGDFGISTATSKYVAEYNTTDKNKLKSILFNSLIILLFFGSIVTLLTIFFGKYFLKEKYEFILYTLPLLFLAPISSLYDGIFRGLKRFKELAIISLSVGIFSIGFVYFLISNYSLIGALISQVLFYLLLVFALFSRYQNFYFKINKDLMKSIANYSLVIGISSVAFFMYSRADILVLGHFGFIEEIGYYEIINKIFQIILIPFILLATVIAPNITSYFAKKEYSKIKEKIYFFIKLLIPLGILIALAFYFFFPPIIKIFLSKYYITEMLTSMAILTFLIPTKIWGVFLTNAITVPTGYAAKTVWIILFNGILNLILDIIFVKNYGFIGVIMITLIVNTINIFVISLFIINQIKKKSDV
jgi:O-antigen/teichoic acid export membrane protein